MIEIHAIKVPSVIEEELFSNLLHLVSRDKKERITRYMKQKDAYRTLLGELLVRSEICKKYNVRNSEIDFEYNIYKKPFLKQNLNFFFNISHSGEWVICATHNAPVGIDIEHIRSIDLDVALHIAKCFFAKEEYEELLNKNQDEQIHYFYDLWTLKESFLKALGKGLTIPLNSFVIKKYNENHIELLQENLQYTWFFKQYYLDKQHKLAVCGTTSQFPNRIEIQDITKLNLAIK
ncbi:4'-phosphopantetheinyl transferase family protein [Bacillus thuringiensis]|uniref:4'-phosphopantetheinyl transferase family protein n=1 Tax=Bacillus thuringiensis TaxID=1428 RepID=UPI000BF85F7D|nr:4'-phosphopantetheinyl transferase superfamily protein [Bacillus thuringiensis]PEY73218.1 4-phosphopantetheinyl transferase [Bacillus thuringiensis]